MVDLLVTYMELREAPPGKATPLDDISLECEKLAPADYLALYRAVGEPVQWDQRLRLDAAELSRVLDDPGSRLFVLRRHGTALGMCEFAEAGQADVELVHFGLVPRAQGQGLGGFLLNSSLRRCWSSSTHRIWLHTDTNDHQLARSVYEKAGFVRYLTRWETFPD